jgi:hypothetical protein
VKVLLFRFRATSFFRIEWKHLGPESSPTDSVRPSSMLYQSPALEPSVIREANVNILPESFFYIKKTPLLAGSVAYIGATNRHS